MCNIGAMEAFMKTILCSMLFLSTLSAGATEPAPKIPSAAYNVKLEMAVDGKLVASPDLKVSADEKAVVTQKAEDGVNYVIEVLLHPDSAKKKVVIMNFTVSTEAADGKREVIATPQVTVKERKGATVTVNKSDGSEKLSLKVWAKKITKK